MQVHIRYLEAQFIVPDWGDKVDYMAYGMGCMSYRPVRLHRLPWGAGTTTLCHIVDFIPH
jgi:hypothetical protein